VQAGGLNLVFDAGRGVAVQLASAGVTVADIDAIFITHHHFDHIGGLGDLIMAAWNNKRETPLPIYGPVGTEEIITTLLEGVYWRDVNYRVVEEQWLGTPVETPMDMVEIHERMTGEVALTDDVTVTVGEVEHGGAVLELPLEEWATVGYRVSSGGRHAAISGDAVAGKDLNSLAANADVLVMCAYLAAGEISSPMTRFLVEHVLAGAPQAAAIAQEANVRRLVLTHIRAKSEAELDRMKNEVAEIFDGEIIVGSDLLVIDA
jgi:ribonuclease Z